MCGCSTVVCSRGMVKSHLCVEFRGSIQRVGSLKLKSLIDFVYEVQAGRFETIEGNLGGGIKEINFRNLW